jgi:DNA-binding NarL/FixJ family response regulator
MPQEGGNHFPLTPAERRFLPLLGKGKSNADICGEIGLEAEALRKELQRFYNKTGMTRGEAIGWAKDHDACCIAKP